MAGVLLLGLWTGDVQWVVLFLYMGITVQTGSKTSCSEPCFLCITLGWCRRQCCGWCAWFPFPGKSRASGKVGRIAPDCKVWRGAEGNWNEFWCPVLQSLSLGWPPTFSSEGTKCPGLRYRWGHSPNDLCRVVSGVFKTGGHLFSLLDITCTQLASRKIISFTCIL